MTIAAPSLAASVLRHDPSDTSVDPRGTRPGPLAFARSLRAAAKLAEQARRREPLDPADLKALGVAAIRRSA